MDFQSKSQENIKPQGLDEPNKSELNVQPAKPNQRNQSRYLTNLLKINIELPLVQIGENKDQHKEETVKQDEKKQAFNQQIVKSFKELNLVDKIAQKRRDLSIRSVKVEAASEDAEGSKKHIVNNLLAAIELMSKKERLKKAVRHLHDGLNLRIARSDIDTTPNYLIIIFYYVQTSNAWKVFMLLISFSYSLLSFFEPSNREDTTFELDDNAKNYEILVLSLLLLDLVMETVHMNNDYDRKWTIKYWHNRRYVFKLIFVFMLLLDYIYFYSTYPIYALRFARCARPFLIMFFSSELRRSFKSILYSIKQIFQLMVFFISITLFFAILGWKFIGDMDNEVEFDQYESNFSEILTSFNIMYALISFDGYPDCMLPSISLSPYYLIYFILYLSLFILLFVPVPVAFVFEAFRSHRSKLVIMDRIKQREALLNAFICLDLENSRSVDQQTFTDFMILAYMKKRTHIKRIRELYLQIDTNDTNSISLNEFFELIDILEQNPKWHLPSIPDSEIWDNFRKFINKYLKFKLISKSSLFEGFMFLILIVNSVVIIGALIITDEDQLAIYDQIDGLILYFYIAECVIKIIGFGLQKYWDDDWNKFDFIMVLISVFSTLLYEVISVLSQAKTAKAGKLLRLTKLNRLFKMFRAFRTVKFCRFLAVGAETFDNVKQLIQRIFTCIPLIFKLTPIMFTMFYVYAIIGMEIFNTKTFEHLPDSPYATDSFVTFNTFYGAIMILFQVMVEANWSAFTDDYAYKFQNFPQAVIYFCTWHMFISLILLSLIKGIVWEVFTAVQESSMNKVQVDIVQNGKGNQKCKTKIVLRQNSAQIKEYELILIDIHNSFIHSEIQDECKIQSPKKENYDQANILKELNENKQQQTANSEVDELIKQQEEPSVKEIDQTLNKSYKDDESNIDENIDEKSDNNNTNKNKSKSFIQIQNQELPNFNKQMSVPINFQKNEVPFSMPMISIIYTADDDQQNIEMLQFRDPEEQIGINNDIQNNNFNYNNQISEHDSKDYSKATSLQPQEKIINTSLDNIDDDEDEIQNLDQAYYEEQKTFGPQIPNKSENIVSSKPNNEDIPQDVNEEMNEEEIQKEIQEQQEKHQNEIKAKFLNVFKNTKNSNLKFKEKDQLQLFLKRKIKTCHFLVVNQVKIKKQSASKVEYDPKEEYFDTDDEDSMRIFAKQLYEDLVDNKAEEEIKGADDANEDNEQDEMTQNAIIKKAYLKDKNMELIKKLEIDYFQDCYGHFFNIFHEVNVSPILRFESHILFNFQSMMRHQNFDNLIFFNCLKYLEISLSDIIFRKGSFFKFVFQDDRDNWFCLSYKDNGEIHPCLLNLGPWTFYNQVFRQQKQQIYHGRDIFYTRPNDEDHIKLMLTNFYDSFKICAESLSETQEFMDIHPDQNRLYIQKLIFQSDFFTYFEENQDEQFTIKQTEERFFEDVAQMKIQIEQDNIKRLRQQKIDSSKRRNKPEKEHAPDPLLSKKKYGMLNEDYINQIDIKNFKVKLHVKKVEIVILSFIGEAVKKRQTTKITGDPKNLFKQGSIYNFQSKKSKQTDEDPDSNQNPNILDKINNIRNSKVALDKDKINDKSSLPLSYVVEMLQSFGDILKIYKQNMMIQVSLILNKRLNYLAYKENSEIKSFQDEVDEKVQHNIKEFKDNFVHKNHHIQSQQSPLIDYQMPKSILKSASQNKSAENAQLEGIKNGRSTKKLRTQMNYKVNFQEIESPNHMTKSQKYYIN